MDSNKRLILTVILSVAIILGFQLVYPMIVGTPPTPTEPAAPQGEPAAVAPAPTEPAPGQAAPPPGEAAPAEQLPEQRTTLRNEKMVLTFSSHGAGIVEARLEGRKGRRQGGDEAPQVDLAEALAPTDPALFETHLAGSLPQLANRAPCRQVSSSADAIAYRCGAGPVVIEKRFRITGPQTLDLEVDVVNQGQQAVEGSVELLTPARVDPEKQQAGGGCGGFLSAPPQPTQAICRHGDDVTRYMFDPEEKSVAPEGAVAFAGFEERYFLAIAVPTKAAGPSSCKLEGASPELISTRLLSPTGSIPPGGTAALRYQLVLGTKDLSALQITSEKIAADTGIADPLLEETVDLGFWAAIARILLALMKVFHALLPNWGVAIILLTLTVKVLTFPLAWKSMKSMEEMRKLAPEVEALKKKYPDDREKLNLEMMALYQRHKVNPLGGCLPMLIQMPIWLALYTALQTSVELYNEPFIAGWINDLTSKDPFYVLPLAMGVTMFITQKMQPMQVEPVQQKMMLYFMPIFFTFIMLQLPAGLTLYIFTNNLLSIGQQLWLRKKMGMPMVGAAGTAAGTTVAVKPEGRKSRKSEGK